MQQIASHFNISIEDRDADQLISHDTFELRYHPDDRGFSYMTCRILDDAMLPTLKSFFSPYLK